MQGSRYKSGPMNIRSIEMEGQVLECASVFLKRKSILKIEVVDLGQLFRVHSYNPETLRPSNAFDSV